MQKYKKAKDLLNQCFNILSSSVNTKTSRKHIKKAIESLDNLIEKKQTQRKNEDKNWWSNIEAGACGLASKKISSDLQVNSIKNLDKLIQKEQKNIENNFLDK